MFWLIIPLLFHTCGALVSGDFIGRSQFDLKIQAVLLPHIVHFKQTTSHNISCCIGLDSWPKLWSAACETQCRIILGVCLSENRPAVQHDPDRFSPKNRSNYTQTFTPSPLDQWRRTKYRSVDVVLLPSECGPQQDHIRTDLWMNTSHYNKVESEENQAYQIRIGTVPQHEVALKITLYHQTAAGELLLIDHLQRKFERLLPGTDWSTVEMVQTIQLGGERSTAQSTTTTSSSSSGVRSLRVQYRYNCRRNYYGPSCNHFCSPRDSALGHYNCHPHTGAIVCHPGWTGTWCNIAMCPNGCVHGICEKPNVCRCTDGWTGPTCNKCIPIPGCVHGQCAFNMERADFEPYTCHCNPNWIGMLCNINTNACSFTPDVCQNGGTCLNTPDESGSKPLYVCMCSAGFRGTHCEQRIPGCAYHGCSGVGTCQPDGQCNCRQGYYGSRCQFNQTNCMQRPCMGELSKCTPMAYFGQTEEEVKTLIMRPHKTEPKGFQCHCEPGRYGTNCEHEANACETDPCFNGGRCVNLRHGYRCICPPRFSGEQCQVPVQACQETSCANNGECLEGSTHFTCHCPFGWTGPTCRQNVNECAEVPRLTGQALCEHGAGCRDLPGTYQCLCPEEWTGKHCELPQEVVRCFSDHNCSQHTIKRNHTEPEHSISHVVTLFTIVSIAIPITIVASVCGIVLLISNYRSRKKEQRYMFDVKFDSRTFKPNNSYGPSERSTHLFDANQCSHLSREESYLNMYNRRNSVMCLMSDGTSDAHHLVDTNMDPIGSNFKRKSMTAVYPQHVKFGPEFMTLQTAQMNFERQPNYAICENIISNEHLMGKPYLNDVRPSSPPPPYEAAAVIG